LSSSSGWLSQSDAAWDVIKRFLGGGEGLRLS
jgi:hypothetical protein